MNLPVDLLWSASLLICVYLVSKQHSLNLNQEISRAHDGWGGKLSFYLVHSVFHWERILFAGFCSHQSLRGGGEVDFKLIVFFFLSGVILFGALEFNWSWNSRWSRFKLMNTDNQQLQWISRNQSPLLERLLTPVVTFWVVTANGN